MALFFDRYTEPVPTARMRVVTFRHPQNPSPLPDLGAYARKRLYLLPITALHELPVFLGRSGRRGGHGRCRSPLLRWCGCTTSACFSLWGRRVRGVPVCHTRSISQSYDILLSPCRWSLSALRRRCP